MFILAKWGINWIFFKRYILNHYNHSNAWTKKIGEDTSSALHLAVHGGFQEVVEALLEAPGLVGILWFCRIAPSSAKTAVGLPEAKADMNQKRSDGCTPAHAAAEGVLAMLNKTSRVIGSCNLLMVWHPFIWFLYNLWCWFDHLCCRYQFLPLQRKEESWSICGNRNPHKDNSQFADNPWVVATYFCWSPSMFASFRFALPPARWSLEDLEAPLHFKSQYGRLQLNWSDTEIRDFLRIHFVRVCRSRLGSLFLFTPHVSHDSHDLISHKNWKKTLLTCARSHTQRFGTFSWPWAMCMLPAWEDPGIRQFSPMIFFRGGGGGGVALASSKQKSPAVFEGRVVEGLKDNILTSL